MEHTPILPPATHRESIGLVSASEGLSALNAPSGAPGANFEHAQPGIVGTLSMQGLGELLHVPIPKVARALAGFDRDQLGAAIEVMIALLDVADGDPDGEPNGDERDGTGAEDDFFPHSPVSAYPGCPISDPDTGVEDDPEGIDPETDYGAEELGELDEIDYGAMSFSDPQAYREQKRRIHRERCWPRYRAIRDWRTGEITRRELIRYALRNDAPVPSRRSMLRRKRGLPRKPRP